MIRYFKVKPLGILHYNNKVVNHRSMVKVLLNPIMRMFGCQLGSYFEDGEFLHYEIMKAEISLNIFKNYYRSLFECNEYDKVEFKHWLI